MQDSDSTFAGKPRSEMLSDDSKVTASRDIWRDNPATPGSAVPGIDFAAINAMALEIGISADREEDFARLQRLVSAHLPGFVVKPISLLDLVLAERLSWAAERPVPDILLASYQEPFKDLKVVADLKRNPRMQLIPIVVLLNEPVDPARQLLLQVGVTAVLEHSDGDEKILSLLHETARTAILNRQLLAGGKSLHSHSLQPH